MGQRKKELEELITAALKDGNFAGTSRAIARRIERKHASVSACLSGMARKGLVERTEIRPYVYRIGTTGRPIALEPRNSRNWGEKTKVKVGGGITLEADGKGFLVSGEGPVTVRLEPDKIVLEIARK